MKTKLLILLLIVAGLNAVGQDTTRLFGPWVISFEDYGLYDGTDDIIQVLNLLPRTEEQVLSSVSIRYASPEDLFGALEVKDSLIWFSPLLAEVRRYPVPNPNQVYVSAGRYVFDQQGRFRSYVLPRPDYSDPSLRDTFVLDKLDYDLYGNISFAHHIRGVTDHNARKFIYGPDRQLIYEIGIFYYGGLPVIGDSLVYVYDSLGQLLRKDVFASINGRLNNQYLYYYDSSGNLIHELNQTFQNDQPKINYERFYYFGAFQLLDSTVYLSRQTAYWEKLFYRYNDNHELIYYQRLDAFDHGSEIYHSYKETENEWIHIVSWHEQDGHQVPSMMHRRVWNDARQLVVDESWGLTNNGYYVNPVTKGTANYIWDTKGLLKHFEHYRTHPDEAVGSDLQMDFTWHNLSTLRSNEVPKEQIRIYPNPAHEYLTISGLSGPGSVLMLYTSTGRLIKSVTVQDSDYQLNIATLPQGAYYLKIHSGDHLIVENVLVW